MQIVIPGLDKLGTVNDLIARYEAPPLSEPFGCSAGLAKSILQKAIRRGDIESARRAATTLLRTAPDQLWRRLCGIATEDIGFGNWQAVEVVTRLAHSKRVRNRLGDDWHVAAFSVDVLCRAPKCRASDDLFMVSNRHPSYVVQRSLVKHWTDGKRLEVIVGAASAIERAIATSAFLLADSSPPYWTVSRERADRLLRALFDSGVATNVIETADKSFRVTGELLPFMACLIAPLIPKAIKIEDDAINPTVWIAGMPNFALDLFSAEGRKALLHFLTFDCPSANAIRATVPASKQLGVFGHLLFRVEGQQSRKRRRWQLADSLGKMMDAECHSPYFTEATHIPNLIAEDLPLINLARHEVGHG